MTYLLTIDHPNDPSPIAFSFIGKAIDARDKMRALAGPGGAYRVNVYWEVGGKLIEVE